MGSAWVQWCRQKLKRERGKPIEVELDPLLEQLGGFGCYQYRLMLLVMLPLMTCGIYMSNYVFNAASVEYRCVVPECESPPYSWQVGEWGAHALEPGGPCRRRRPTGEPCSAAAAAFAQDTQPCDQWVYRNNNTIAVLFNLACSEWKRAIVGTVHSLGVVTALLYVGVMSDNIGRLKMLVFGATAAGVMGTLRTFSDSYLMYMVCEYLEAVLGAGAYSSGYVLAIEMMEEKYRVVCGGCMSVSFALGAVLLALAAWAVPNWKTLTLLLYAPSICFVVYLFWLDESIRWLLVNGKKEKALKVFSNIAKANRKELPPYLVSLLNQKAKIPVEDRKSLVAQVLRSKVLIMRMIFCTYCWITVTLTYYGLNINSVTLGGNMYVNFILTSLVEVPGYLLAVVTLDRFGRKRTITAALILCGIALLTLPFVNTYLAELMLSLVGKMSASSAFNGLYLTTTEMFPTEARHAALAVCSLVSRLGLVLATITPLLPVMSILGKGCVSLPFGALYTYTLELFPTSVRHSCVVACSTAGQLGTTLAPLTPILEKQVHWLPYAIFGSMALGAAGVLTLLPETLHQQLPDTVAQAETLNRLVRRTPPDSMRQPSPN